MALVPTEGQRLLEKEYTPEEKKLCEILVHLCGNGIKVELGWGIGPEPAWYVKGTPGTIIICKKICNAELICIHSVPPDIDAAITAPKIIDGVGHAYAHLRSGSKDHDINFYKSLAEVNKIILTNYVKRTKTKDWRNPMKTTKVKFFPIVRKVVWAKTPEIADKVVKLIVSRMAPIIVEHTPINSNETELVAKNLEWYPYSKLLAVYRNLEHAFEGQIKFQRAKNH